MVVLDNGGLHASLAVQAARPALAKRGTIRTEPALLGHAGASTSMICTPVLTDRGRGVISPLAAVGARSG